MAARPNAPTRLCFYPVPMDQVIAHLESWRWEGDLDAVEEALRAIRGKAADDIMLNVDTDSTLRQSLGLELYAPPGPAFTFDALVEWLVEKNLIVDRWRRTLARYSPARDAAVRTNHIKLSFAGGRFHAKAYFTVFPPRLAEERR